MVEHAPETDEGHAALHLTSRGGVWKYAGMGGCAGLDWPALAIMPEFDQGLVPLLSEIEAGRLEGEATARERERAADGDDQ